MEKLNSSEKSKQQINLLLDEQKLRTLRYSTPDLSITTKNHDLRIAENLQKICEDYKLDYKIDLPDLNIPLNEKLNQLLHEYRVVSSIVSKENKGEITELIKKYAKEKLNFESESFVSQIHAIFNYLKRENLDSDTHIPEHKKIKHPSYSLEHNAILAFIYIAARNSGNPVFLIEIIKQAANNKLPYFTGYSLYLKDNKSLNKGYSMIPANLPNTEFLRKIIWKMTINGDCELKEYPAKKCFLKIYKELEIPHIFIRIAECIYQKFNKSKIKEKQRKIIDEAFIIGSIIFAIKLIYGLNDKPYVNSIDPILREIFPPEICETLEFAKKIYSENDKSLLNNFDIMKDLPNLYEFGIKLREKIESLRKHIPWKLYDLHNLNMKEINEYLEFCENTIFSENEPQAENSENLHIFKGMSDIFKNLTAKPIEIPDTQYKITKNTIFSEKCSDFLMEELEFVNKISGIISENPAKKIRFPRPCDNYAKYKQIFSDLTKDPISFEYQYFLILFSKYLGEPINQIVRAIKIYEDLLIS